MSDGRILIDIAGDAGQFKQALNDLKRTISADVGGMGSIFSSLGDKVSGVGKALTVGITTPLLAAGVAASKFSLSTVAAAEQASIAFETMLGPKKAKEMLSDLADFAANTPFELQGLQTSTQRLLAMGFTAEECIPLLTAIGDAASGLGAGQVGIDSITRALGQMNTKGKVLAEEMMQLTETGIPAWQYLADVISDGDIPAAMQEVTYGFVDSKIAIEALQKGMNKDFGGMMSKQAKTLTGVLSNMADAVQKPLMAVKDTKGYEQLTSALKRLSDALGPFIESLMPHLEKVLEGTAGGVDYLTGLLDSFTKADEKTQSSILGLIAALGGTGPALMVVGKTMGGVGSVISTLTKEVKLADSTTTTYGGKLKTLTTTLAGSKLGAIGLGGAVAAIITTAVVNKISEYIAYCEDLNQATVGLANAEEDARGAIQATGDAAEDGSVSMVAYKDAVKNAVQETAGLAEDFQKSWEEFYAQEDLLNQYVGTIEELGSKSKLSATEQAKLKTAVEGYNSITGESIEITDAVAGELSESTDQIRKNADAWIKNAKAQAYQDKILELQKQQIENEDALEEALATREKLQKRLADEKAAGEYNPQTYVALADNYNSIIEAREVVNQTTATISDYTDKLSESEQSLLSYMGTNANLMKAIGEANLPIEEVATGFEQLGITQSQLADMTPSQISSLVSGYQSFKAAGMDLSQVKEELKNVGLSQQDLANLTPEQIEIISSAYKDGKADISQICQAIKDGTVDKLGSAGSAGGDAFSKGLASKKGESEGGGKEVVKAADKGSKSIDGSSAGKNFVDGFVGKITNSVGRAFSAAYNFVKEAIRGAAAAQDSNSPSKETAKLGSYFIDGYVGEIGRSKKPYEAGAGMASDAVKGLIQGASNAAAVASSALSKMGANTSFSMPVTASVSRIAIPDSAVAELSQVSSATILGQGSAGEAYLSRIADSMDNANNKLEALTTRIDTLEENLIDAFNNPVQLKVNQRELGRITRGMI